MFDFLIVGGGLIGLMTARELTLSGAKVALIDKGEFGQEASWAAGGILSPLFPWDYADCIGHLSRWSQLAYPQLAQDLKDATGIDPEYELTGMLMTQEDGLDHVIQWCRKHGVMTHPLNAELIRARYPELTPKCDQGILLDHIAHIRPPRLIKALIADLKQRDVQLFEHVEATEMLTHDDQVISIKTRTGRSLQADQYVLCSGAWTRELWPEKSRCIDIRPVKGQIILYPPTGIELNCMYLHDHRYLIQRRDGQILVGSSLEHSGFDKRTTTPVKESLIEFAESVCPALEKAAPTDHWAGLRPAAPGSIPYIGRHPKLKNLSVNAGHFRNGIILAPGSARLLADELLNLTPIMPAYDFAVMADRAD